MAGLTVQQTGVPAGYEAAASKKYGILLHRTRPDGRPVCGRARRPYLPRDAAAKDARVCGSCSYALLASGKLQEEVHSGYE